MCLSSFTQSVSAKENSLQIKISIIKEQKCILQTSGILPENPLKTHSNDFFSHYGLVAFF